MNRLLRLVAVIVLFGGVVDVARGQVCKPPSVTIDKSRTCDPTAIDLGGTYSVNDPTSWRVFQHCTDGCGYGNLLTIYNTDTGKLFDLITFDFDPKLTTWAQSAKGLTVGANYTATITSTFVHLGDGSKTTAKAVVSWKQ